MRVVVAVIATAIVLVRVEVIVVAVVIRASYSNCNSIKNRNGDRNMY